MVAPTNLFVPSTPHEYRPAGEPRPLPQPSPAGGGGRLPPDGGQMPLADAMARAIAKEGGAVGRYDVARRLFRAREGELLTAVARGDKHAFHELDQLRKGPLYFPASRFEGAVDYGPGAPSHAMRPNGDFLLGVSNTGDDLPSHPAVSGSVPRITVRSAEQSHRARPQRQPPQQPVATTAVASASRGGERPSADEGKSVAAPDRLHRRSTEGGAQRDDSESRGAARRQAQREKRRGQEQHAERPPHREERQQRRSKARAAPRRQGEPVVASSPFIGSGVPMERTDGGRSTAGMPAGVWNGGGHLPEGKRHLSELKHLPGWTAPSTVAGQRQQRDELTVETARPLPAGWAKLRSRSMPAEAYYHDARSGESRWTHPSERSSGDMSRSTTAWEETPRVNSKDQQPHYQQRGASATSTEISTRQTWTPLTSSDHPRSRTSDGCEFPESERGGVGGRGVGSSIDPAGKYTCNLPLFVVYRDHL